jgi:hypothetical protein
LRERDYPQWDAKLLVVSGVSLLADAPAEKRVMRS